MVTSLCNILAVYSLPVVYFHQQMVAPHTVHWLKSFVFVLKQVFSYFSVTNGKKKGKPHKNMLVLTSYHDNLYNTVFWIKKTFKKICIIFLAFFPFQLFGTKKCWKSILQPALGVRCTRTLVQIYYSYDAMSDFNYAKCQKVPTTVSTLLSFCKI